MNAYEKKLRKKGVWIEAGHTNEDGVTVLHHLPPSQMARVITRCPKCKKISVFWLSNYKHGRSKCSHGCFKGRRKEKSIEAHLPGRKESVKLQKKVNKKESEALSSWDFDDED